MVKIKSEERTACRVSRVAEKLLISISSLVFKIFTIAPEAPKPSGAEMPREIISYLSSKYNLVSRKYFSKRYWAIGERQLFPVQTKSMRLRINILAISSSLIEPSRKSLNGFWVRSSTVEALDNSAGPPS